MKVVWRFNLRHGEDAQAVFAWLRDNVWASSARFGCETRAFRLEHGAHAFGAEAIWPDDAARVAWQESGDYGRIPNYPGTDSPWGGQVDLEFAVFHDFVVEA